MNPASALKALIGVVLLIAGTVTGCATLNAPLIVLGPWTGDEETAFKKVLQQFEEQNEIEVRYQGARAVNQVLLADVRKGQAPDVAVLSSAGELARYAKSDDLIKITDKGVQLPDQEYGARWRELLKLGTPDLYAVPVKADLKSIVWFNSTVLPGPKPGTWAGLLALTRELAGQGVTPWCLGLESNSTSGWPGTDWIEDILLRQAGPGKYQSWAAGELPWTSNEVRQAWTSWGELIGIPGAVRGGGTGALLTYFNDANRPMSGSPPGCLLAHQPSFAIGGYPKDEPEGQSFDFFPFPDSGTSRAYAVGVNLAGMFRDSAAAQSLMKYLVSAEAQAIWPKRNGTAFSVNKRVPDSGLYRDRPVSERIAETLTSDIPLCLDASDVMAAEMADAFFRGVLEYVDDPTKLEVLLDSLESVRSKLSDEEHLSVPCG